LSYRRTDSSEYGYPRGVAQSGSALGWGPSGRWFKSSRPDSSGLSAVDSRLIVVQAVAGTNPVVRPVIEVKRCDGGRGDAVIEQRMQFQG
jgi:hypothetical protein